MVRILTPGQEDYVHAAGSYGSSGPAWTRVNKTGNLPNVPASAVAIKLPTGGADFPANP